MQLDSLAGTDPEIYRAVQKELERQQSSLELIASENFPSRAVLEAQGSVLTSKYAEGYPGRRYYGGCEWVDVVENLAIERVRRLFGAEHANVQPHSGTQANLSVYFSILQPGDTILSMALPHGGHLSHGHRVSVSGKLFQIVQYGVSRATELIDFEEVQRLALEHQPKLIICGASAYPRTIDFERFRGIADSVGAYLMVDMAHIAGLIAAEVHPSPMPWADFVTTTTHKTLRGPRGGAILCRARFAEIIDRSVFPGGQGGPLMHVIAAKAVAFREALQPAFKLYQQRVVQNARALAQALSGHGFRIVAGGTDTHLLLVDLTAQNTTGADAERRLESVGITVNKNAIPYDPHKPNLTSGIRLGTPAVTTRGMGSAEMETIAAIIADVLTNQIDPKMARQRTRQLCEQFPLYAEGGTCQMSEGML